MRFPANPLYLFRASDSLSFRRVRRRYGSPPPATTRRFPNRRVRLLPRPPELLELLLQMVVDAPIPRQRVQHVPAQRHMLASCRGPNANGLLRCASNQQGGARPRLLSWPHGCNLGCPQIQASHKFEVLSNPLLDWPRFSQYVQDVAADGAIFRLGVAPNAGRLACGTPDQQGASGGMAHSRATGQMILSARNTRDTSR